MTLSYLQTDGGKLAIEINGDGPLIVCSPALGDLRNAYDPLAAHLKAHGYRVVQFDLRGHGDSSATFNRYGDSAVADDLLAVIKHIGGGPAVVVGASLSAGAAVIAAGRRPELVAGLVLICPFLRDPAGALIRGVFNLLLKRPLGPFLWRRQVATLWPGLGTEKAADRAATTVSLLQRPGCWSAFQATVKGCNHTAEVTPWISKVRAPVLVVMGQADPDWSDPHSEAQWVASNFQEVNIVMIPDAGHAPHLERPNEVIPAVSKLVAGAFRGVDGDN